MQVQGCKRPNRLSAGEMPGSTEREERDKDNPTQPNPASQPVSGPEWSGAGEGRADCGVEGGVE